MIKASKLSLEERRLLWRLRIKGVGVRQIARVLGRAPSTVSRELKRNLHPSPRVWRGMSYLERAKASHDRALRRRSMSRKRERLANREIRRYVLEKLIDQHWSPEQIAGRISQKHPELKVSAKTIYNFIKYERPLLKKSLRLRGVPRRQRVVSRRGWLRQASAPKRSIELRPAIESHKEFGHWEIDTIHSCKGGSGGILTLRELKSRRRFYFLLADLKAESVTHCLLPFFQRQPEKLCKTLTSDNGSEFTELYKLEKVLADFKVYYCHPYCAHERGSVEHANGELRWYFPKGTDFSKLSGEELKQEETLLNNRPMQLHAYQTPAEVFEQAA